MKDGELEPTYVAKREELKELVTSIIRPKIVQGKSLNGKEFVSFLEQVVHDVHFIDLNLYALYQSFHQWLH